MDTDCGPQIPFIFDGMPALVRVEKQPTIQAHFYAFHDANPWVYNALVRLARKYRGMGRKRVGIKHLFEILRWEYAGVTRGDDFKLNNDLTSRYARFIQRTEPDLFDVFETRELKAA